MPKQCAICDKKYIKSVTLVKLRGKYNPTSSQRKHPNLQWVRLVSGQRVKACTNCIKTLHKTK